MAQSGHCALCLDRDCALCLDQEGAHVGPRLYLDQGCAHVGPREETKGPAEMMRLDDLTHMEHWSCSQFGRSNILNVDRHLHFWCHLIRFPDPLSSQSGNLTRCHLKRGFLSTSAFYQSLVTGCKKSPDVICFLILDLPTVIKGSGKRASKSNN